MAAAPPVSLMTLPDGGTKVRETEREGSGVEIEIFLVTRFVSICFFQKYRMFMSFELHYSRTAWKFLSFELH